MPTKRKRSASDVPSTPTLDHIPEVEDHGGIHASFRDLMPNSPQTIAFLHGPRFSDAMNEAATAINITGTMNVTSAQAVEELRRFLALKVFIHDDKAEKLSPTPLMTFMWQAAILDTQFHLDLQASLPFFIHYRPSEFSAAETEARRVRLITMESLYSRFFGTKPLGAIEQPRENAQGAGPNPEDNGNALILNVPDQDTRNDDHVVVLDDSDDNLEDNGIALILDSQDEDATDDDDGRIVLGDSDDSLESDDDSDNDSENESVKLVTPWPSGGFGDEQETEPVIITIRVRYPAKPQLNFDHGFARNKCFAEFFHTISHRVSLPDNRFIVRFAGVLLGPWDTPDELQMRDGDTVEVYHRS